MTDFGISTINLPESEILSERRGPLCPLGSFVIWTRTGSPQRSWRPPLRAAGEGRRKIPSFSSPKSTKAALRPGTILETLPK